jgi:beta-glucanase (GH16 family)
MKMAKFKNQRFKLVFILLVLITCAASSIAQTKKLVWSDEFDGPEIKRSNWKFESGFTNDNLQFYTDRIENAKIVDGKLQIIALKETYQGYKYTSALLETSNSVNWKYGRVEARIKLPGTPGFVPAFWMLPADNIYGFWPKSGEMDIMEYPTTQGKTIYGTIHSGAYNLFNGEAPKGNTILIADAESTFHVYAIEWSEEKIDFYVDDQKYYTFTNNHEDFKTWPFNQPFYLILNLAVGGGWVGEPDNTTQFPAVMEIDYVRVYQNEKDIAINGPDFLPYNSQPATYSTPVIGEATYSWTLPGNGEIISGQNTSFIKANWNIFGGIIHSNVVTDKGTYNLEYPVDISYNLMRNYSFEKGVKYWTSKTSTPAITDIHLDTLIVNSGKSSLLVDVQKPGINTWDVQLAQRNLLIINKQQYKVSFWAKTDGASAALNAAIIRMSDNTVYSIKTFTITNSWTKFELDFKAVTDATVSFNIDMGSTIGKYYLDDFIFSTPELIRYNQLENADFEKNDNVWQINTYSPAQATGTIKNGEFAVSIDNGGLNIWDVYFGQSVISVEKGNEYIVSFDAYSEDSRTISAFIGKNSDPWTVYSGNHIISLTSNKQTYSYSFIMNDQTDYQARFGFDIGLSSSDIFIDNVFLSEGNKVTESINFNSETKLFNLIQNYPNPFNQTTMIKYNLAKPENVTIIIFDFTGKEIVTLVDGFQDDGEHQIQWNANGLPEGLYFCKLQADGQSETIKISIKN